MRLFSEKAKYYRMGHPVFDLFNEHGVLVGKVYDSEDLARVLANAPALRDAVAELVMFEDLAKTDLENKVRVPIRIIERIRWEFEISEGIR